MAAPACMSRGRHGSDSRVPGLQVYNTLNPGCAVPQQQPSLQAPATSAFATGKQHRCCDMSTSAGSRPDMPLDA